MKINLWRLIGILALSLNIPVFMGCAYFMPIDVQLGLSGNADGNGTEDGGPEQPSDMPSEIWDFLSENTIRERSDERLEVNRLYYDSDSETAYCFKYDPSNGYYWGLPWDDLLHTHVYTYLGAYHVLHEMSYSLMTGELAIRAHRIKSEDLEWSEQEVPRFKKYAFFRKSLKPMDFCWTKSQEEEYDPNGQRYRLNGSTENGKVFSAWGPEFSHNATVSVGIVDSVVEEINYDGYYTYLWSGQATSYNLRVEALRLESESSDVGRLVFSHDSIELLLSERRNRVIYEMDLRPFENMNEAIYLNLYAEPNIFDFIGKLKELGNERD